VDASSVASLDSASAPPLSEHLDLTVPAEVARDAAAIVDAALGERAERPADTGPTQIGPTQIGPTEIGLVGLTEPQRAILEFERQWWRRSGAKEQAIRDTFGLTPTRYYQSLNRVLDLPAAMRYDAALVHRLQRLRAAATRGRRLLD
jgi:hypothetical protein